jgi:hypothetical protein
MSYLMISFVSSLATLCQDNSVIWLPSPSIVFTHMHIEADAIYGSYFSSDSQT